MEKTIDSQPGSKCRQPEAESLVLGSRALSVPPLQQQLPLTTLGCWPAQKRLPPSQKRRQAGRPRQEPPLLKAGRQRKAEVKRAWGQQILYVAHPSGLQSTQSGGAADTVSVTVCARVGNAGAAPPGLGAPTVGGPARVAILRVSMPSCFLGANCAWSRQQAASIKYGAKSLKHET